jgi:hypothetical protein
MKSLAMKSLSLGVLAAVSWVSGVAHAGSSTPGFFRCTANADGSGSCSGTYNGARVSTDANDQVSFTMDNGGFGYFGAVYGGRSFSCTKSIVAGSLDAVAWNAAISSRNYFYVTWDSTGTCSWVYIGNMSAYLSVQ